MNGRARVCRACGGLNAATESRCYRCGAGLSGVAAWGPNLEAWFARPGVATQTLFALCALDFAFMVVANRGLPLGMLDAGPRLSALFQAGALFLNSAQLEPWRLLSAVYTHVGILHLGMNMLALFQLGRPAEASLGSARVIILFTLTGILGFVASGFWYGALSPPTAGASGALFGLLGQRIAVLFAYKHPAARSALFQELAFAVALALVFPVNNAAHFGGFVTGFGLGWLYHVERRKAGREKWLRYVALGCLIAGVASVVLSATSPLVEQMRVYDALRE